MNIATNNIEIKGTVSASEKKIYSAGKRFDVVSNHSIKIAIDRVIILTEYQIISVLIKA